jgi:hypothetical protein
MILQIFKQIPDILSLLGSLILALLLGWCICLVYIKVSCYYSLIQLNRKYVRYDWPFIPSGRY